MKNFIIALLLTAASISAYAQNDRFTVINNNTLCNVNVTMYAQAPTTGDVCFDLIGSAVSVPAGTAVRFDADILASTYGWLVETVPVSNATLDFFWASAHFTFSGCPSSWGCTPAGGNMGDSFSGCTSTSNSFSSSCSGHTISGTWTFFSGTYPTLVSITFN